MRQLRRPDRSILTGWDYDELREACARSSAALNFSTFDERLNQDLFKAANFENLFLVDSIDRMITYESYGDRKLPRAWGRKDMMLDLGIGHDDADQQRRMGILTAAAHFRKGAVHLFLTHESNLSEEEERGWIEALSLAADRDAAPSTLLIESYKFRDVPALLRALKKNKHLKHLSFQDMHMSDECVEVLRDFTSLTSLHLDSVRVSSAEEFVGKLAELHPSHSPLAASLHRLHITSVYIDLRRSTGFLRHWPELQELSLKERGPTKEEEIMEFMEHLAPSTKETGGSIPHASPPQLYSLDLSSSAIAKVVDALSGSGLPFFEYRYRMDALSGTCLPLFEYSYRMNPAVRAQLRRNQRDFRRSGFDSARVSATSMRLFICGDPFAGKTTVLSTMRSMYSTRKRDKFIRPLFATQGQTQGIEVGAIEREGIRVSLWDMAGRPEFHAFHDCMFPDIGTSSYQFPSMFMFVWSPIDSKSSEKGAVKKEADFEASFRYWLKFLASKSRQSNIALIKVMVVFTRADQMEFVSSAFSPLIDSFRSDFRGVIDIFNPPFDVDTRKKDSVKPIAEHIFIIARDMLQGIQVYNISTQIHKRLRKHSKNTNERIITWEKFSEICYTFAFPNDNAKLKAMALSLNDSGNIIYINGIRLIVLNPNWFCNEVMGSLIDFLNSKASQSTIILPDGCISRDSLEECLESIVKSKVKGSLLVDLMEAMHLCCKVIINNGVPNSHVDCLFIPALLTIGGVEQLQWRSSTTLNVDDDTFVYMGRRLECEDKEHTFLTPGLFPRVQVLFYKAFQLLEDEYKADVMLGKDFISICYTNVEIIIMFCQAKSEHVIDVLVRANNQNNGQQHHTLTTLVDIELKHIIDTLVMVCAQPTGIRQVRLSESIIRPDFLRKLSKPQDREDQSVKISYLKEQLKEKLLQGEPESYEWKWGKQTPYPLQNDFIDLLGYKNYGDVLMSSQAWLKEEKENPLLYITNDEINISREQQSQQRMTTTTIENSLLQNRKNEILEEGTHDEVRCIKIMAKAISNLHKKRDANHKELLEKMDAMHYEFQCMRKDVITKVEKSICKQLKVAMENKVEKQLPCVAIITTNDHEKKATSLVTSLLGALSVQIHLYCEHATLPHPVENQPGITLTSWSESLAESLHKVLPYIIFFFSVLTTALRLRINCLAPHESPSIPNWTSHLKLAKEHLMISSTIKSKFDISTSSKIPQVCPSTLEYFKEWQTCLEFILKDNGGVTDQNIAEKFCLWHANIDGGNRVAWLCKKHYDEQRLSSLS